MIRDLYSYEERLEEEPQYIIAYSQQHQTKKNEHTYILYYSHHTQ